MSVLRVNIEEKERIEQWTRENTFPNIIQFVEDADGNWIVGEEVLRDPAYAKLGKIDGQKEEVFKDFIESKCVRIEHKPKEEPKEEIDVKSIGSGRLKSSLAGDAKIVPNSYKISFICRIWRKIKRLFNKIIGR